MSEIGMNYSKITTGVVIHWMDEQVGDAPILTRGLSREL